MFPVKRFIIMAVLCSAWFAAFSQYSIAFAPPSNGQSKDFVPASPTASSLGVFGQVPIGNYTGIPQVSVPLYNLVYKDLQVPISLSYHSASGIRPDNYPGLVGLGWGISSGGSITRVVRSIPDNEPVTSPDPTVPFLNSPTSEDIWSSDSMLTRHQRWGFFVQGDFPAPDEYYFNFNGYSGKFFINYDSVFKIQSSQGGYLSVKAEFAEYKRFVMPHLPQIPDLKITVPPNDTILKQRILYAFTITDEKGIKYRFGGTDSSIELSRPGHNFGTFDMLMMQNLIIPTTWNLSSIESPNNYKITFNYKRGIVVTKVGFSNLQRWIWSGNASALEPDLGTTHQQIGIEKSTLVNVNVLTSIVTPRDSVVFTTSPASAQLQYPRDLYLDSMAYYFHKDFNDHSGLDPYVPVNENMFIWYPDINYAYTQDMIPDKLDRIRVLDKNNKMTKDIRFNYTNNTFERLKLLSVSIGPQVYQFEYNPLKLPPYLSGKTDHYGYYNGREPYKAPLYNADANLLYQSKEPDTAFVRAEILEKLIYPTGGYTVFEYEPNYYSVKVNTWPFTTTALTQNLLTSGVRIKRISSYDAPGKVASEKRYSYVKDYAAGGTLSSGVLAYSPVYSETFSNIPVSAPLRYSGDPRFNGLLSLEHWSVNPIFPMSATRGNPITYSEVAEINADNSFIVYKYKNYDNGYHDIVPVNQKSDNTSIKEFWKEDEGSSLSLERGQPLSEDYYNASNSRVKRVEYQYNDDPARFDNHIRTLMLTLNNMPFKSRRVTASYLYTYFPFLKKTISTEYYGIDSSVITTTSLYDNLFRTMKETVHTTSTGEEKKTTVSYAHDKTIFPYDTMVRRGMVGIPVEVTQYTGGVQLSRQITNYVQGLAQDPALILPGTVELQYRNRAAETRARNYLYNKKGNLLCESAEKGIKTCYVWSYGNSRVIAKIAGADYATVEAALGGSQAVEDFAAYVPVNDNEVRFFTDLLRQEAALEAAFITTYTYSPYGGVSSESDASGKTTYYDYDQAGRLSLIRDHNKYVLKKICYDYSGRPVDCDSGRLYSQQVTLGRALTKSAICSGDPFQIANIPAYKSSLWASLGLPVPIDQAGSAAGVEADTLLPSGFYADADLTTPLPDGYYKDSGPFSAGSYIYIVNGKTLYENGCGMPDPLALKYAGVTTPSGTVCSNSLLPTVYTFPASSIASGAGLYANYSQTMPVRDGWYAMDNEYFKVENGIIQAINTCAAAQPVNSVTLERGFNSAGVCSFATLSLAAYYQGSLGIGTVLYGDPGLATITPARYYRISSLGIYVEVNASGMIVQMGICQ
ncbi:RHS repeat domain-containing protein [Filimonas effusa]|uniref:YD repeat-containing protein n=1 Tax=Filimonas effusa TaxID=2508721 RepID=A0A4Q1DAS8_9BACT|nr:hypothetical protein [Filimonas effusa]RXK86522.1 hypothetical protein ESB13_06870 [Filimonas effusa]